MRYTTDGFQQDKLMELGLNRNHSYVLRWLVDFQATGQMREHLVEGISYYWVSYGTILEDLPILGIQKRQLANIFKDLVNAGVLKHFHLKQGGSFSFYTTGDAYDSLIYDPMQSIADPLCNKLHTPMQSIADPYVIDCIPLCNELPNKDSSIIDYPIKDTSIKKQNKAQDTDILFEEFWKSYPRKDDKQPAMKSYQRVIKGKLATHEELVDSAKAYTLIAKLNKTETKYIKLGSTWLNNACWENTYSSTISTTPSTNAYDALLAKIKSLMDQEGNFSHAKELCNIYNIEKFISADENGIKVYYTDARGYTNPKYFTIEAITKIGAYC